MTTNGFICKHSDNCPLVTEQRRQIAGLDDRVLELMRELRTTHMHIGRLSSQMETLRLAVEELKRERDAGGNDDDQ